MIARNRPATFACDFPILAQPTSRGKPLVYLDSAATSQKPRSVIDAIVRYYENDNANIHRGVYELAERATNAYENARAKVAGFVNASESAEIVFVRNTTEAINLVAQTWGLTNLHAGDPIVLSRLEHHSNLVPWQRLAQVTGAQLRFIEIDAQGTHCLENLDALLAGAKIVALAQISNTLGTIAPLERIIPKAHAAGAIVLIDGAQSIPHRPIDVRALDCDFFCGSGHKMCGPTGIGFLYGKRALLEAMPPFLSGGDMIREVHYDHTTYNEIPWKFEAGTGNIADVVGLGAAIDYLEAIGMDWIQEHERRLTAYAFERLRLLQPRGVALYGPTRLEEHAGVLSFNVADVHAHDVASILDIEGICIRAGHHCTMPLMEKMGWTATARASFYLYNTERDIDALIDGLEKVLHVFKVT